MFYKIGFWVLLVIVLLCIGLFVRTNPMKNQGAMSWIDIYSEDDAATLKFLNENFDIKVTEVTKTPYDGNYSVIKSKGSMWPFAGVMGLSEKLTEKPTPGSLIYLTVKDYDAAHAKMTATGAKAIITDQYAGGMRFGIYEIPGNFRIGIAQYEHVKEKK